LAQGVKKKKKKIALPRRQWQINPVTRDKALREDLFPVTREV